MLAAYEALNQSSAMLTHFGQAEHARVYFCETLPIYFQGYWKWKTVNIQQMTYEQFGKKRMEEKKITLSFKIVTLNEKKQKVWVIILFCKCYFKVHFANFLKSSGKSTVSLCQNVSFLSIISLNPLKCDSLKCPRQNI